MEYVIPQREVWCNLHQADTLVFMFGTPRINTPPYLLCWSFLKISFLSIIDYYFQKILDLLRIISATTYTHDYNLIIPHAS